MSSEPADPVGAAVRERCAVLACQRVLIAYQILREAGSPESETPKADQLRDLLGETLRLCNIMAGDPGPGDVDWLLVRPRNMDLFPEKT